MSLMKQKSEPFVHYEGQPPLLFPYKIMIEDIVYSV